jgi:site-specific DNA-cytosine methylase
MLYVVDLFCGAGGFSEGARQAGATIVLAVDSWKEALDVHAANHPHCEHWCEELGGDVEEFAGRVKALLAKRVPTGGRVHIHASPPCQNLSSVNPRRNEREGLFLVEWSFQVVRSLSPDTYTLEQVVSTTLQSHFPEIESRVYKTENHGVPQTRARVIYGFCPILKYVRPATLREIMAQCDEKVLPGDVHTNGRILKKGSKRYTTRGLDGIAYTLLARYPVLYNEGLMRRFNNRVCAALQTFPPDYNFGDGRILQVRKMIANAVSPTFAKQLVTACIRDNN